VGKTTLVNQLIRPVTERMGLFLGAKFDQVRHLDVYQGLSEVLEEFCNLVLSEPTPSFEAWQEKIQTAVAPHGQLLPICARSLKGHRRAASGRAGR
jgi:predicted ATPase